MNRRFVRSLLLAALLVLLCTQVFAAQETLAALRLDPEPEFALTDGFAVGGLTCPALALWKGDQVAACVAAASIIAKVTRDRIMTTYDEQYDGYGFAGHKGYCTAEHQRRLEELGPCPIHRMRYVNVRAAARVAIP